MTLPLERFRMLDLTRLVEVLQSTGYSENEIGALGKAGVIRAQNHRP